MKSGIEAGGSRPRRRSRRSPPRRSRRRRAARAIDRATGTSMRDSAPTLAIARRPFGRASWRRPGREPPIGGKIERRRHRRFEILGAVHRRQIERHGRRRRAASHARGRLARPIASITTTDVERSSSSPRVAAAAADRVAVAIATARVGHSHRSPPSTFDSSSAAVRRGRGDSGSCGCLRPRRRSRRSSSRARAPRGTPQPRG